jgi:hypothetical protein
MDTSAGVEAGTTEAVALPVAVEVAPHICTTSSPITCPTLPLRDTAQGCTLNTTALVLEVAVLTVVLAVVRVAAWLLK